MGSVFRQQYRTSGGKSACGVRFSIRFKDHHGFMRQVLAMHDERASAEMLRRLESLVSFRAAGMLPPADLARWMSGLPAKTITKLVAWGVADEQAGAGKTITQHLSDYKATLIAEGVTEKHAARQFNRVTRMLAGMKITQYSALTKNLVTIWLAQHCKDNDLGNVTYNHHLNALKAWCNWMISDRRAVVNPVAEVADKEAGVDRRYVRRALTNAESSALILTTKAKKDLLFNIPGWERALIYRLALETGLRSLEIRSLKVEDFALGLRPAVTIRASGAKNRRQATLPLRAELASEIESAFGLRAKTEAAFHMPYENNVIRMLRKDLESIGVSTGKAGGARVDFHSLRHTFCTNLANAGVLPHVCQKLARHSSIELTMKFYTHLRVDQDRQAIDLLPGVQLPPEEKKEESA